MWNEVYLHRSSYLEIITVILGIVLGDSWLISSLAIIICKIIQLSFILAVFESLQFNKALTIVSTLILLLCQSSFIFYIEKEIKISVISQWLFGKV